MWSWVIRKISKEFDRFLERGLQRTANRIQRENDIHMLSAEYRPLGDATVVVKDFGLTDDPKGNQIDKSI